MREHADATGCQVLLPEEPEAVLLGSAILGAVAAERYESVPSAMAAMTRPARILAPGEGPIRSFHDAKYEVFQKLYDDQLSYRRIMSSRPVGAPDS